MDEQVLIVGAGPVGMLLACELLAQGVDVRVIDAAREPSAHSRATIVWPRMLELMRRTGITERLVDAGHPIDGVTYFSRGEPLGTAWMNQLTDTAYPFAIGIAQHDTEKIIEGRLAELGGKVERGLRLVEVREPDSARPTVALQAPGGSVEELSVAWLIGADGAHSTVRKLIGASFEGSMFDVSFAVTDAEITGDVPLNVVSYCYTPQGSLAFGPLGGGVSRVAVSVPHATDDTPPTREFFQAIVDERGPGRNTLGTLRFSTVFRVHARIAARFRVGHCLLIGDAAHIMSPAGAQGMNTGLQDAVNLGWRLAGVVRGRLPESVVAGYDRERRDAAHAVARITALQTDWGLLRDRRRIAVRDAAIRVASRTGVLQRTLAPLVAQTGVRYPFDVRDLLRDGAPIAARTRPGERLPVLPVDPHDASTGSETRVAGRMWTAIPTDTFTILAWRGVRIRPGWRALVASVRASVDGRAEVIEPRYGEGPLSAALGDRPSFAVVRPDGYLFAVVPFGRTAELSATLDAARRDAPDA